MADQEHAAGDQTDPRYRIVYDEALRRIKGQEDDFSDLRGRSGTLIGVAALSASFLGGLALRDKELTWGYIGLVALVFVTVCVLYILWPREWLFYNGTKELLRDYVEANPPASEQDMYKELAGHLETDWNDNDGILQRMFIAFELACLSLGIGIIGWIADIVWGR